VDLSSQRTLESPEERELALAPRLKGDAGQPDTQESRLLVVARLLWQQRVRLAKNTFLSLAIAAVIALLIPRSYESNVQLMPPDDSSNSGMTMMASMMGQTAMSAGGSMLDLLGAKDIGALFMGVMRSRTIGDRIIDRFDLRKVYWRKTYIATRAELASRTTITADRKTKIISIAVRDHDRARAAAIAQAYVDELNRLLVEVNTSSARREREFLEQRLAVVHKELDDSAKELSQFSSKTTTLDPQEQGKAMVEAAAMLQGQVIAAQSELSGLEQIYTSDNVRVRTLRAHVAELQQQLDKLGGKNYQGSTTVDPDALYPSLRQLPVLGLRYMELYRQVKVDEIVFQLLTEQYELARVEEAKETPSVKVLDAARPPEKPVWPPRTLLTFVGGLLGFVFASCWIVAAEAWSEVDFNEPHKAFLRQVWAETQPVLQKRASQLRARLGSNRNGSGNFPADRHLE
jgi:uncharacterized protein involved in exopolysaccharide biosynthesis